MRRRIIVREEADRDLDEIAQYIATDNLEAGKRFYDASQAVFELLSRMPRMGTARECSNPRLEGLRSFRIRGYDKYIVFYLPLDDLIEVVRVHGARDVDRILERE